MTVVDAEQAEDLVQRLRREVDSADVEFEQARQQVRIEVEKNPDETLGAVLNLLESWLGEGGRAPTDVEIDDRRYVLGAV
ncbi:MAG TPA: hypothetical protein VLK24_12345 [Gaiellaceae bacterium]|nr:hypothetical protein [Gaiellaceae bacterium]